MTTAHHPQNHMTLYDQSGRRKYINQVERERFIQAAMQADPICRSYCLILAYTGCRPAEARLLHAGSIQILPDAGIITIRTLKKRKRVVYREVPVPPDICRILDETHKLSELQQNPEQAQSTLLYSWGNTHGWKIIKTTMKKAGIVGIQASPKGLRHAFCIWAIECDLPLTTVKDLAGHEDIRTTEIYATPVGKEKLNMVQRMWMDKEQDLLSNPDRLRSFIVDCIKQEFSKLHQTLPRV